MDINYNHFEAKCGGPEKMLLVTSPRSDFRSPGLRFVNITFVLNIMAAARLGHRNRHLLFPVFFYIFFFLLFRKQNYLSYLSLFNFLLQERFFKEPLPKLYEISRNELK